MRKIFLGSFVFGVLPFLFVIQVKAASTPYNGTPWAVPGTIQIEDYDLGGEGVAFHDTDITNNGSKYRSDAVDIETTADGSGSAYQVGWVHSGEWLKYSVNVATTGTYTMMMRASASSSSQNFHLEVDEVDGVNKTGSVSMVRGVWVDYQTLYINNVELTAGQHVFRLVFDNYESNGWWGFNWMNFKLVSPVITPIPVTIPEPGSQIFYVSPSGNDSNSGTLASPWKTITKAAETLTAGQTVYIRAGTYKELLTPKNSGRSDAYVIFSNYPGETVTLDAANVEILRGNGIVSIINKSFIRVTGLRLINAGVGMANGTWTRGITTENSDHLVLDHNYIGHTFSSGIAINSFTSYSLLDNNEVTDTNFGSSDNEVSLGIFWFSNNIEVRNNKVHDGHNEGLDPVAGAWNIKVHDNVIYNMGRQGFYVDSWTERQRDIEFYNNIAYNNGLINGQGGFLISSEEGGVLTNVSLYNNISYNNKGEGFYITAIGSNTHQINNISIVNNTIYKNVRSGILVDNSEVSGVIIRNNIVYQNGGNIQIGSAIPAGTVTQDHNLTTDPKFVNVAANDFHLQSSSSAINTGSMLNAPTVDFDGKARPIGTGIDIGAYEYGVGPVVSPTPGIAGDLNHDQVVNIQDFILLSNDFNRTGSGLASDLNYDLVVNIQDFIILSNNFGKVS